MLTVPGSEIARRIVDFQARLVKSGVDAALIRQNADIYYFSGTVQDAHLIIPAEGTPMFLVRRSVERAQDLSPIRPIVPLESLKQLPAAMIDSCGGKAPGTIGMELDVLPTTAFFYYDEFLFPRQRIVDVSGAIRETRMVKSTWELSMMREAGIQSLAIADAVPEIVRRGVSELELYIELQAVAQRAGSLGTFRHRTFDAEIGFGHILSGPEATIPSYTDSATGGEGVSPAFGQGAAHRPIEAGEVLSVDTITCHHGYMNDQTRNFCLGRPPERLADAYKFVKSVHDRFRRIALPGAVSGELYETAWNWARQEGWADWFMGAGEGRISFIGHGIGIEIDEYPFIARGQRLPLVEGMTFAFEPKILIPGVGTAGLENTYVVTETGLESLNPASEEMVNVQPL